MTRTPSGRQGPAADIPHGRPRREVSLQGSPQEPTRKGRRSRAFAAVKSWMSRVMASIYAGHYFHHHPEPPLPDDDPDFSEATAQYEAALVARAKEEAPVVEVPYVWEPPSLYDLLNGDTGRRRSRYGSDHCWETGWGDRPDGGGPPGAGY